MAKKKLKKEIDGKKRQHSRNFREELFEFLVDVRRDIADGAEFHRDFKPHTMPNPDDDFEADTDAEPGLYELFERSGLDISAPGHWQFLLIAMLNAMGPDWTRIITDWTETEKNRFLLDVLDQRSKGPKANREELCERLKLEKPGEYAATAGSLRVQLQLILKEKRDRVAKGTATDEEIALLQQFDG
jgi:hypothetical protein